MPIGVQVISSTMVQIAGKIITIIIALLSIAIITRYFSTAQLADYGTIFSLLAIFSAIADMGVYTITLREMGKNTNEPSKWYSAGIVTRLFLVFSVLPLLVFSVSWLEPYKNSLVPVGISIAMISSVFSLLSGMVSAGLQHAMKIQYYTFSLVMGKIITFLLLYSITQYFFTTPSESAFFAIILSGVIGSVCTFVLTWFFSTAYRGDFSLVSLRDIKNIIQWSFPMGISALFAMAYVQMGMISFRFLLPESVAQTSESSYFIIMRIMDVIMIIPIFFMSSVIAPFSNLYQHHKNHFKEWISLSIILLSSVSIPLSLSGMALSSEIITLLSPDHAAGSWVAFSILLAGIFFAFLNIFTNYILTAMHQEKMVLFRSVVAFGIAIFLMILLVPHFFIKGAAIATLITEIIIMLWGMITLYTKINFHIPWKPLSQILFSSVCIFISIFFTKNFLLHSIGFYAMMALELVFSILLFYGILFIIGFFTPDFKKIFAK